MRGDPDRAAIHVRLDGTRERTWIRIDTVEAVEPPGMMPMWLGIGLGVLGASSLAVTGVYLADNHSPNVGFVIPGMLGGVFMLVGGATWAGISGGARARTIDALDDAGFRP